MQSPPVLYTHPTAACRSGLWTRQATQEQHRCFDRAPCSYKDIYATRNLLRTGSMSLEHSRRAKKKGSSGTLQARGTPRCGGSVGGVRRPIHAGMTCSEAAGDGAMRELKDHERRINGPQRRAGCSAYNDEQRRWVQECIHLDLYGVSRAA